MIRRDLSDVESKTGLRTIIIVVIAAASMWAVYKLSGGAW